MSLQDEISSKIDELHDLLILAEKQGIGGMIEYYDDNWKVEVKKLKYPHKQRSEW